MRGILTPLIVTLGGLLVQPAYAQLPPEQAVKSFTVADGLQIELFAAEPMFSNPTCIDIDHKGRAWVCESVNYRCHLRNKPLNRKEGDRIVVLEDSNGDGKADKAATFYQAPDFIAPLGIAIAPEADGKAMKVYVCHSPHIYVFEDKNGDLEADGPPRVLLTGFNGHDHDHGVHGIHIGPDGKLYFSVGDTGVKGLKDRFGKVWTSNTTDCRAGTVWRCDMDGKNLELLAHNFRNAYEPAVDSFGTCFISDNDDDGNEQTRICYVMYGGNYGYHPRGPGQSHWHEEQPGVVHKVLRTGFGSPTGMCWYEGTLLRSQLSAVSDQQKDKRYGLLLHTDAGPRHVRCYHVFTKGAGYEIEPVNVVTSTDNWFRPSDVCVAPDGSIFVSDWYDPGVGGHGMGDTTRGRIYRITPKGEKRYAIALVDVTSRPGVEAALGSPNIATRQVLVQPVLGQFNQGIENGEASNRLLLARYDAKAPFLNARVSWLVSRAPSTSGFGISDATIDPYVFFHLREGKDRFRKMENNYRKATEELRVVSQKLNSGAICRELLLILCDDDPGYAKDWIYELAEKYDGRDHFYLAAINIAVGSDPKRRETILADFEKHFPNWDEKTANLVWELRPPSVLKTLDQKLTDEKLSTAMKVKIIDILAGQEGIEGGEKLLKLVQGQPGLFITVEGGRKTPTALLEAVVKHLAVHLPAKWRSLRSSAELNSLIDTLMVYHPFIEQGLTVIAAGNLGKFTEYAVKVAEQETFSPEQRVAAIRCLAALKNDVAVKCLVGQLASNELRKDATQALGRMATGPALEALQKVTKDEKTPLPARHDAVAALAGSRKGASWLLDANTKKELPPGVLPEVSRQLRASPYVDLRNRALIAFPVRLDPKRLPAISELATRKGDAGRGKNLFVNSKDLGCARCHSIKGEPGVLTPGGIGPDLGQIGKKASRENLFESLLAPDKAVADQFVQFVIERKDGVVLTGLVIEDKPEHLLLRDAQGNDTKIPKNEIEEKKKSPKSIMPDDLLAHMTEQDLLDVVEFLQTLK